MPRSTHIKLDEQLHADGAHKNVRKDETQMSDMDGIGTRDEWYDERIIDDDMSVAAGLLDENA